MSGACFSDYLFSAVGGWLSRIHDLCEVLAVHLRLLDGDISMRLDLFGRVVACRSAVANRLRRCENSVERLLLMECLRTLMSIERNREPVVSLKLFAHATKLVTIANVFKNPLSFFWGDHD